MLYICCFIFFFIRTSTSIDSIAPSQSIKDGETLVSAGGTFELGFFSPGSSKGRYVGIWYKESPSTVVWVANRETQLNNTFGVLQVKDEGVLVLVSGTNSTVWSSNTTSKASNPIAQLLDTGNLILRNGNVSRNLDNLLWQSFDYPCDTFLSGMKLGWNLETGLERFISSWKSTDDPSPGEYTGKIDRRGYPQAVLLKGNEILYRAGSWNGLTLTGNPARKLSPIKHELVLNDKELYLEYELLNESVLFRFVLSPLGSWERFLWKSQQHSWEFLFSEPSDQCENYGLCGENSVCNISNSPICFCLKGFVPKNQVRWDMSDWSSGCIRNIPLECNNSDGFQKYMGMKLPDTSSSWYSMTMDLQKCEESCLKNCSCTAYANLDIRNGGSGCLLWFDGLIDIRQFPQGGQDLYIRVPASELDLSVDHGRGNFNKKLLYVGLGVGGSILVMGFIALGFSTHIWKKKLKRQGMTSIFYGYNHKSKHEKEDTDMTTFDLSVIVEATNNFSCSNKLGEGGFGPVYKGTLTNGQEIAIKRLSKNSGQGPLEFKNEVVLIAKLQHRNLVKLLGCCIQGGEKLLIYEYMRNKSLDYFIFDETQSQLLDWPKRFQVIGGIARGILYLHQDSRLKIIHRDLKTSNILLDAHMNPKISDFGLARAFEVDQIEANTNKVVGTYGYMPPEYAIHGHFSIKSDVFSFGVIILEIVSGKKNRVYSDPVNNLNLLGYAWRLWTEERSLELIDEFLGDKFVASEVIRCIHVGLLCVQQKPDDRPDMPSVVLMLNGEKLLPNPKAPGFYSGLDLAEANSSPRNGDQFSSNQMSLSIFDAR